MGGESPGYGTFSITSFGANTIGGPLTQPNFTFNPLLPAYSLVNLRVGLVRNAWEFALFGNNVTDERALLALDRERGRRARVGYLTNQPRTIGVPARLHFGGEEEHKPPGRRSAPGGFFLPGKSRCRSGCSGPPPPPPSPPPPFPLHCRLPLCKTWRRSPPPPATPPA